MPSARVDGMSRIHLPLARLGMCLDCEVCFEIGTGNCPGCGGGTWIALAKFLETARHRRMVQGVESVPPAHPNGRAAGVHHFIIVARDREALYQHFKQAFAGNPTIDVMLDRRHAERRGSAGGRANDRRRGDRRWRGVEDKLRVLGWAVVRVAASAPPLRAASGALSR